MNDSVKKTHLLTLLRLYGQGRDVDSLAGSLDVLLEGPIERRLIQAVRCVCVCVCVCGWVCVVLCVLCVCCVCVCVCVCCVYVCLCVCLVY